MVRIRNGGVDHIADLMRKLSLDLVLHHCNDMLQLFFCLLEIHLSHVGSSSVSRPNPHLKSHVPE